MLAELRRPFTADNGRVIFRRITSNRPWGYHLTQTTGSRANEIDSNNARNNGSNGTSLARLPAVEVEIYFCAGSGKSIVLERTTDRQQGQRNPNTTIKDIKLTLMQSISEGTLLDSFDCCS